MENVGKLGALIPTYIDMCGKFSSLAQVFSKITFSLRPKLKVRSGSIYYDYN